MLTVLTSVILTFNYIAATKEFTAQSDGSELSCELQAADSKISAGNIFALAQDSPGANWYPSRIDLNDETVTRLGDHLSFPYYQMGGVSADPVNHLMSLIVDQSVYTLSTITGDVMNQVTPTRANVKFFQYDYVSGRLVAMYWDSDAAEEHVVFINEDGSVEEIVVTTSCFVINSARTMDYDNGIFYYIGIECIYDANETVIGHSDDSYLYGVNINDQTFDKMQLSTSVSYINFANGKLYALARVIAGSYSFALSQIDVASGDIVIVDGNAKVFESVIISDNTIDEGNALYIKFGDNSNMLELVSLETGEIVQTLQFEQYVGPMTFEPICVCCVLQEMDESETRRRLIDFDDCNVNKAWEYNVCSTSTLIGLFVFILLKL